MSNESENYSDIQNQLERIEATNRERASAVAVPWISSPGPHMANFTSPRLTRRTICCSIARERAATRYACKRSSLDKGGMDISLG